MPTAADWTVICLCAEWCGACRDYRRTFDAHAARAAAVRHVWIDIEDDAELIGDIDVETLPTLLVLRGEEPLFFGPVLPHLDVLERTLRSLREREAAAVPVPSQFEQAVARLSARLIQGAVR
jgi:thioredoxin 1